LTFTGTFYCFWKQICGLFELCYVLQEKTEICMNVGKNSFSNFYLTNSFKVFCQTQRYPTWFTENVITGVGWNGLF
jgi:hypothetical protein